MIPRSFLAILFCARMLHCNPLINSESDTSSAVNGIFDIEIVNNKDRLGQIFVESSENPDQNEIDKPGVTNQSPHKISDAQQIINDVEEMQSVSGSAKNSDSSPQNRNLGTEASPSLIGFRDGKRNGSLTQMPNDESSSVTFDYQCLMCKLGSEILFKYHKMGWSPDGILKYLSFFCSALKIQSKSVCYGVVESVGQQLFAVLDLGNDTILPIDLCGMVYGGSCALQSERLNSWSLDIPDLDRKPPTRPPVWPKEPTPATEKILHISDTHIQLDYVEGTSNLCTKPVCCSLEDGQPATAAQSAGHFGDYNCDLPKWTFEEIIKQVSVTHPDIDYIFLTGDFPAHDIWRQNRTQNIASVKTVADVIEKYFPDVKVFPAVGNHESFPVNMFPDSSVTGRYAPTWLYSKMAEIYKAWLPDEEQQNTLRDGGYYSTRIRPHLRVISINTNFCNNFNFWLLANFNDPHNHLHWLYRQLRKAEMAKERVFLLGHIPPGTESCLDRWSREYNRIVYRFRNTIVGQFFGHTHNDEFELFFSPHKDNPEVVNIGYLAPSQTPHDGINPAYRLYTIDGVHPNTTNLILNHETFWLNLTESNLKPNASIQMKLEYTAKNDFVLDDMSPLSWFHLVERMAVDIELFDRYRKYYSRFGPHYYHTKCDITCREQMLCSLVTSRYSDQTHCDRIKNLVRAFQPKPVKTFSWWSYLRESVNF